MSRNITYDVEASVFVGVTGYDLGAYVTNAAPDMDVDRTPFVGLTLTLEGVPAATKAALDPRRSAGAIIACRIIQSSVEAGGPTDYWPGTFLYADNFAQLTNMYVVDYVEDDTDPDVVTVTASSAESRVIDKAAVRTAPFQITAATNVNTATVAALNDVFGSGMYSLSDPLNGAAVAIAAGDRRYMQPGQSWWDFLEPEVTAAGGRLFADPAGSFALALRSDPPRSAIGPATITASGLDVEEGTAAFPVTKVTKRLTRTTDWADAVVCKFSYLTSAGVQTTAYQIYPAGGANTRAQLYEFNRPAPANNMAQTIQARALQRGSGYDVEGAINFRARPGVNLNLIRPSGTVNLGMIRSVEWDIQTGKGVYHTEIGQPV